MKSKYTTREVWSNYYPPPLDKMTITETYGVAIINDMDVTVASLSADIVKDITNKVTTYMDELIMDTIKNNE